LGAISDVESPHVYFKPVKVKQSAKPIVLSEFGGYSFKPAGHAFNLRKTYGYRFFDKQEEFEEALYSLYLDEIVPAVEKGLCGAIYTQVSDIEDETNGLLSYDRRVLKVDVEGVVFDLWVVEERGNQRSVVVFNGVMEDEGSHVCPAEESQEEDEAVGEDSYNSGEDDMSGEELVDKMGKMRYATGREEGTICPLEQGCRRSAINTGSLRRNLPSS
jgi:hypothetical protein